VKAIAEAVASKARLADPKRTIRHFAIFVRINVLRARPKRC